jgi:hypothetical protein
MKKRVLYGTNELVEKKISNLKEIDILDSGWSVKYKDTVTGELWIKYTIDPDRGYFFNLMRIEPTPSTEQLIDIALTSEFPDEVSAAAHRLHLEEELSNTEFRDKLLDRIKQIDLKGLTDKEKKRIETIIVAGQLTNRINTSEIIRKKYNEINSDYKHICQIADETEIIMRKIKT